MAKITLKEALKQASVVDELKNFVGLTKDDALGLMTPERLAAVAGELLKSVNPIGNVPIVYRGTFVGGDSPIELNLCTGILITFQEGAERMNLFIIDYWTDTIQEKFKNGSNIKSVTKAERSGKVTISVSGGNFTYLFIGYNYRN